MSIRQEQPVRRGFTVIELLVVFAILAVAVAIVIPAVQATRRRSAEMGCQANLRALSNALLQYTVDNGDRYPFGFTWNRTNLTTGRPTDGAASGVIAWYSLIDQYLTAGSAPNYPLDANTGFFDGATRRDFSAAFRCPSVSSVFQQRIQYYQHPVVMPHWTLELPAQFRAPGMPVVQPARAVQLYPDTALIWDTPTYAGASPFTPSMFWVTEHTTSGFAPFVSDIDQGGLTDPRTPELRFRGPGMDRFINSTNAHKNPNGPIYWPSDAFLQSFGAVFQTFNTDYSGGTVFAAAMGGPRFRHPGQGCNVLFADGSVRTLYLHPSRKVADGPVGQGAANFYDTDFRRYMLMIKWPPGFYDTNTVPTN